MEEWFIVHDGYEVKDWSVFPRDIKNYRHMVGPFETESDAYSFRACVMGRRDLPAFIVPKEKLPFTTWFTADEWEEWIKEKEVNNEYRK